jgi:hypothetical protein
MSTQYARPKWWQVYLTLPLLIGLFILDNRLELSIHGHQALQIGIILLVYGLIHLWIKANARALSEMDQRQYHRTVTVIRVPVSQLSDPDVDAPRRKMLELPASEIKGVLSDAFEVDYIDMEFVQQEQSDGRVDGARSVPSYRDHQVR